jgi:DNA repair exonuclease SbcCD ATPase subunit
MTALHDTKTLDEYIEAGGKPFSAENQRILGQLVEREVVHCCSTMVYELNRMETDFSEELLDLCSKTADLSEEIEELEEQIEDLEAEIEEQDEATDELEEDLAEFVPSEFDTKEYRLTCEAHTKSINDASDMRDRLAAMQSKLADLEDENGQEQEALEHWIVTRWLADKLADKGEITGELFDFHIWGRQTSGQAIALDTVIAEIAAEMGILMGQTCEWSTT